MCYQLKAIQHIINAIPFSAAMSRAFIVLAYIKNKCGFVALIFSATLMAENTYSPYVADSYPNNVYFGDTHVHTTLSTDAYSTGNRLKSEKAYKFAKGETVMSSNGEPVRLNRPLDFLVIADHFGSCAGARRECLVI